MSTITDSLIKAGFEPSVAEIYTILTQSGELSVGQIVERSHLSRAGAYDALNILLAQGYLEYRKEGRNAYYKPVHPDKLFSLIEEKKRETALLETEVRDTIKTLTGAYNLSQNKPGVRFFEGKAGFREAVFDSLSANEPIYSYVDVNAINDEASAINREYVKARLAKGIDKKILLLDTRESRALVHSQGTKHTEYRFLPADFKPFHTGVEIYNNKVVFLNLSEKSIIAFLINDPGIYLLHRHIFESQWNSAKQISPV